MLADKQISYGLHSGVPPKYRCIKHIKSLVHSVAGGQKMETGKEGSEGSE